MSFPDKKNPNQVKLLVDGKERYRINEEEQVWWRPAHLLSFAIVCRCSLSLTIFQSLTLCSCTNIPPFIIPHCKWTSFIITPCCNSPLSFAYIYIYIYIYISFSTVLLQPFCSHFPCPFPIPPHPLPTHCPCSAISPSPLPRTDFVWPFPTLIAWYFRKGYDYIVVMTPGVRPI